MGGSTVEVGSLVLPEHHSSDDNECQLVEYDNKV